MSKGLKINNSGSMFANKPKPPRQEDLQRAAEEVDARLTEYKVRAKDLGSLFKKIIDDKTLSQNKSPFQVDAERDVLNSLIQLAIDMNLDPDEDDAMGSVGLEALLFRTVLIQRDKINDLSYALTNTNAQIKELSGKLDQLAVKIAVPDKA